MLHEGVATLLSFFGHVEEHRGVTSELLNTSQAIVGGVEAGLQHAERNRREFQHLATPGHCLALEISEGHHGVNESPVQCGGCVVLTAEEPHFFSTLEPNGPRE